MAPPGLNPKDQEMGWRHKKAVTARSKDFRMVGLLPSHPDAGLGGEPLPFGKTKLDLALPPLRTIKLSYRQLGSFQGRKVWESSLSFSYFH